MIANSKTVRADVRDALRNKFLRVGVACLIPFFAGTILAVALSLLSEVLPVIVAQILGALAFVFLLYPLILGLIRFFIRFIKGKIEEDVTAVFHYFSSAKEYKRVMHLQFLLTIRKIGIAFLIALPVFAAWVISGSFIYEYFNIPMPIWAQSVSYLVIYLRIFGIFIYFLVTLRYYLAPFLLAADREMYAAEAVYMSKLISKRTVIDFVFLLFSHFFYIAATLLVLPVVFTLPYLIGAYVVHCDSAVEQYNNTVKTINQFDPFSVEGL